MRIFRIICLLIGCLLIAACQSESASSSGSSKPPAATAPDPKLLGVSALTDRGLLALDSYGREGHGEAFFGGVFSQFRFEGGTSHVGAVNSLYVNVPEATITDSKLFRISSYDTVWWANPKPDKPNPKPLPVQIQSVEGTLYKITSAQLVTQNPKGIVALWLKMPMGTPDRLYVLDERPAEVPAAETLDRMREIGSAVEAFAIDNGRRPSVDSSPGYLLRMALSPTYIKEISMRDGWGTEFLIVSTPPNFRLISAGADRSFDEASKTVSDKLADRATDFTQDIVLENGEFLRSPKLAAATAIP